MVRREPDLSRLWKKNHGNEQKEKWDKLYLYDTLTTTYSPLAPHKRTVGITCIAGSAVHIYPVLLSCTVVSVQEQSNYLHLLLSQYK